MRFTRSLSILAGFVLLLSALQASAAPYKGKFTINVPVQWGDVLLQPGTYEFSTPSPGLPDQITLRGNGQSAAFPFSASNDPIGGVAASMQGRLELESIDGTPVVRSLVIPKLGMVFHFDLPKVVKVAANASGVLTGEGCRLKSTAGRSPRP